MKKIPFTRLKIAQINYEDVPIPIRYGLRASASFIDDWEDMTEYFCHADIFSKLLESHPDYDVKTLTDLNKQFISFDYLMII